MTRLGTGDAWIGRRFPCITTALRTGRRIHGSREVVQANAADAGQQKWQLGAVGVRQEAFRKAMVHRTAPKPPDPLRPWLPRGAPFFTALDKWVNLNLVETRTFPDGVLLTRYETRR